MNPLIYNGSDIAMARSVTSRVSFAYSESATVNVARPASNRATGTRNGEQET